MSARESLLPLINRWQEAEEHGMSLSVFELCKECPELIPELEAELRMLGHEIAPMVKPPLTDQQHPPHVAVDVPTPVPKAWLDPTQTPPTEPIGTLGGFQLLKILGEGGMGTVYLAYDPLARRQIALKTMKPEIAVRPQAKERFFREARAAAALQHENITPIYQVGEENGIPFIAMPFLQGETLEDRLVREPILPLTLILKVAREVSEGLVIAHDQGVIHRDIKPANIYLAAFARQSTNTSGDLNGILRVRPEDIQELLKDPRRIKVKILDFGLARPIESAENFTQPGMLVGTPGFMSPEQIDGLGVDPRSDLFSLGCVLYQMATGEAPFQGLTLTAVLRATADRDPTFVCDKNPDIPYSLGELIHQLFAKNPHERPDNAQVVVDTVRIIQEAWGISDTSRSSQNMPAIPPVPVTPPEPPPEPTPPPQTEVKPSSKNRPMLVLGLSGMLIFAIAMMVWLPKRPTITIQANSTIFSGSTELVVWRNEGNKPRELKLSEPGAIPVSCGDRFRIEARLSAPAYVYVFSIDSKGKASPLYPWTPDSWDSRPAREPKVDDLKIPKRDGDGFLVQGNQSGIESLILIARDVPWYPSDLPIQDLLQGLPDVTDVQNPRLATWFENGQLVKSTGIEETSSIPRSLSRLHEEVWNRLQHHAGLVKGITFFKQVQ